MDTENKLQNSTQNPLETAKSSAISTVNQNLPTNEIGGPFGPTSTQIVDKQLKQQNMIAPKYALSDIAKKINNEFTLQKSINNFFNALSNSLQPLSTTLSPAYQKKYNDKKKQDEDSYNLLQKTSLMMQTVEQMRAANANNNPEVVNKEQMDRALLLFAMVEEYKEKFADDINNPFEQKDKSVLSEDDIKTSLKDAFKELSETLKDFTKNLESFGSDKADENDDSDDDENKDGRKDDAKEVYKKLKKAQDKQNAEGKTGDLSDDMPIKESDQSIGAETKQNATSQAAEQNNSIAESGSQGSKLNSSETASNTAGATEGASTAATSVSAEEVAMLVI